MKIHIVLLALAMLGGCQTQKSGDETSAPQPVVDNPATRYVESLQESVQRADEAAELARQATQQRQDALKEIYD